MSGFAFGAFSAYWFLKRPPYHYGAQMAGLLGWPELRARWQLQRSDWFPTAATRGPHRDARC